MKNPVSHVFHFKGWIKLIFERGYTVTFLAPSKTADKGEGGEEEALSQTC